MAKKRNRRRRKKFAGWQAWMLLLVAGGMYAIRSGGLTWGNLGMGQTASHPTTEQPQSEEKEPEKGFKTAPNNSVDSLHYSHLLECPKPSETGRTLIVTHKVDEGKRVNYSLEYDTEKHHARWVAFSFDNYTAQTGSGRNEAWGWDPLLPARYEVFRGDFKGFSRGHLVASNDRTFSVDANKQTFYYSNISPQRQKHNDGIWLQLEQQVQQWGRNRRMRDKLYVVKGGTIRDEQIEESLSGGKIAVPKFYWMALLLQKGKSYYSLAFWTEHKKPQRVSSLGAVAIPVEVLQKRTGIDFFPLLPDGTEQKVEAQQPTQFRHIWRGL